MSELLTFLKIWKWLPRVWKFGKALFRYSRILIVVPELEENLSSRDCLVMISVVNIESQKEVFCRIKIRKLIAAYSQWNSIGGIFIDFSNPAEASEKSIKIARMIGQKEMYGESVHSPGYPEIIPLEQERVTIYLKDEIHRTYQSWNTTTENN